MLVFAISDKGGTGRSVTSSNILYRSSLAGMDVCYVDFDFGSPTAGAMFAIDAMARGTRSGNGAHSYLLDRTGDIEFAEIWQVSDRRSLRGRPAKAGRMVLLPGDQGGAEFTIDGGTVERCRELFLRLEEEFELSIIDLSAGRSYALSLVLAVTGGLEPQFPDFRWLVYHRWTRQHVLAAANLVYEERGILDTGVKFEHDREELLDRLRFVRTAVIDPNAPDLDGLRTGQLAWLRERNQELQRLAGTKRIGRAMLLGSVPIDPLLQWHEQLITDTDVEVRDVANPATVEAFIDLAAALRDPQAWERV